MSRVGKLLKMNREVKERSLYEVAQQTGKSEGHLQHIEDGMLTGTPETLLKVAACLDIAPSTVRDAYLQDAEETARILWNRTRSVKSSVSNKTAKVRSNAYNRLDKG